MTDRYDALTVRESNGKSYFTKLGAMFPNKSGDGFTLVLDAVPASVDGQYRILLILRAAMIPKIELPEATYSVRDGKSSLKIVDVDAVPEAYCTMVRQPVKAAINEAFADASELPNWLVREAARDVVTARTK
jgi:hypothetical protein